MPPSRNAAAMCRVSWWPPEDAATGRPPVTGHLFEDPNVFDHAVAQGRIHLDHVQVGTQAAVAERFRTSASEKRFSPVASAGVGARHRTEDLEVEGIAGLLVPQPVRSKRRSVFQGSFKGEAAVRVDRDPARVAHLVDDRIDPSQVLRKAAPPIFSLTWV